MENTKALLINVHAVLKHQRELTIAKGEHYNMFSVLKIETRENNTHSAFLADLLNPKGAHKMGDVFLRLFLQVVKPDIKPGNEENFKEKFPLKKFETNNAFVKVEESVGALNLCEKEGEDESQASGGRIDIFFKDKNDTIICIENKIHAIDQNKQIQRYYNYKTAKNTVFYLTLKGEEPSPESRLKLNSGEHFYNISYKHDIRMWLESCLKEVTNFTSLRETINQYILLIKKLTYTLNEKEQNELTDIMLGNLEESKYIAENYERMLQKIKDRFRSSLKSEIEKGLGVKRYSVSIGSSIKNKYAQIWISLNKKPEPGFFIGVESFTGKGNMNGDLFVGILNTKKSPTIEVLDEENRISSIWRQVRPIKSQDNSAINLSHSYWIKVLADQNSAEYENLLKTCKDVIVGFVNDYEPKLFTQEELAK